MRRSILEDEDEKQQQQFGSKKSDILNISSNPTGAINKTEKEDGITEHESKIAPS